MQTETTEKEFRWDAKARREAQKLEEAWWEPSIAEWERYTEAERRTITGAIARKVAAGYLLTPKEFAIVQRPDGGFYDSKAKYSNFVLSHYEDEEHRGYLYLDSENWKKVLEANSKPIGEEHSHIIVTFGVTPDEVNEDFLTPYQVQLLKDCGIWEFIKHKEVTV